MTFRSFIISHKLALLNGLILAALIIAPLFIFPLMSGNSYRGITIADNGTDELLYLSRGKDVLEGHRLGNPLFREGKDGQDPFFTYVEYMMLAPVKLLGLENRADITTIYASYNFIGVFVLALLIYFFVLQLSGDRLLSGLAPALVIGGYALLDYNLLFSINLYGRAFSPYIPVLATFLYYNLLALCLKSSQWKYKILAGLSFGFLFYVYLYAWSFILALNGVLFALYFFKKDFVSVKKILIITIFGLGIGSYNILKLSLFFFSENSRQLSYFVGTSHDHIPIFSVAGFVALALLAAFARKNKNDKNILLFLAFILSGWIVLNQQIITGIELQSDHWSSYFFGPAIIIIASYIIWSFIRDVKYKKILAILIFAAVFFNVAIGQYRAARTLFDLKQDRQNYRPIIDYLSKDPNPGVILAADNQQEYLFTIYTPHDLFWARAFLIVNVPMQRVRDALYVYLYLNKMSVNNFAAAATNLNIYQAIEGYASGLDEADYNKQRIAGSDDILKERQKLLQELVREYGAITAQKDGIKNLLKAYGVTYIVWDKSKNPEWDLSVIGGLTEVASSKNIHLYKFK